MILIALACASGYALTVSVDTFTGVDREISGLLDAWSNLERCEDSKLAAQTALSRARAVLSSAVLLPAEDLPDTVRATWQSYLKASADCIFTCRSCFSDVSSERSVELLSASFERWESCGEAFLGSVQSMR